MITDSKLKEIKTKTKMKKTIHIDDDKLTIGAFRTYSKNTNGYLYITSDINTSSKKYESSMLLFAFSYWEEIARSIGINKILISPSVLNYFPDSDKITKGANYHFLDELQVEVLKSEGIFQANGYHQMKIFILDEYEQNKAIELSKMIQKVVKKIKKEEPRTNLVIKGTEKLFFTFNYRETMIELYLSKENELFYLKEDKKSLSYPVTTQSDIEESIPSILKESYNRKRARFLLDPPKRHFNNRFSFLRENEKETFYSHLRSKFDFNKIEDLAVFLKVNHYKFDYNTFIYRFDDFFYLFLNGKFQMYPLEKEKDAKEIFKDYVLKKESEKLENHLTVI